MPKIPVIATVAAAYRYAFANYLRLLGVAWASTLVLSIVVIGLFMPMILAMEQGLIGGDPMAAVRSVGPLFLFEALLLLLLLIAPIGVTRLIFGRPVTWPYFYFGLGGDYWRLVLASMILGLMLIGVGIAVSIPIGILAGSAAVSAGPHADPVALQAQIQAQMQVYRPFIIVPIYAAMLFIAVRFGFFLPAIVVEEKRVGIGRNWTLTRGNSWRIAGIVVLLFLPLVALGAIQFAAIAAFGGPNYMDMFGVPPASLKASGAILRIYLDHGVLYGAAMLLLYPLFYGPFLAASAHAYRAIAGEGPPAQD
ncbi:MAG TPA: hypothetical protein VG387_18480 [Rhizomicrobium sp.]|jgi:hypothetical protein|nr:hypothetical protein [Rhizomicrobium sp.]